MMSSIAKQQALAYSSTVWEQKRICHMYSSPNTNDINTQINQQIPEHTRSTVSCQQNSSELEQVFAGCRSREIPIGFPGPLVHKTEWIPGRHNGWGTRRTVLVPVCFLSPSLSPSFVPRMGSVCVPGGISIREEGGGDDGQKGGGVVGSWSWQWTYDTQ